MDKKKLILVAVDLTEASRGVIREGLRAALAFGADMQLMHVVHELESMYGIYLGGGSVRALQDDIDGQADDRLEALRMAHLDGAGVVCEAVVKKGVPWSEIVGAALHHDSGLIVIGAHFSKKPEHRILGSTVERVLRQAPCPVLVVPPDL